MRNSAAALVIKEYLYNHERILVYLRKLSDEQIHWRHSAGTHSIAWHAWHLARWADFTQASIPAMTPELSHRLPAGFQIWEREQFAERWGFDDAKLGFAGTGMQMPDELALQLVFPEKAELLRYVELAFAAIEQAVSVIDDEQFMADEQQQPLTKGIWGGGTVGSALLEHLVHEHRHLGMMECLLGLQGQPGTATV